MLKNIFLKHGDILRKSLMLSLLVWMPISVYSQAIITTLGSSFPMLNGSDLSAWTQNGNASWQINSKELNITQGNGMLISRISVPDIQMEFDYWVSSDAQVSVFFRCMNSSVINSDTAYEMLLVNQKGGLGAGSIRLLDQVKPTQVVNQWNHMKISAIGTQLSITLNGISSKVTDTRFSAGPVAINYQGGELRLKNIYVTIPGRW
jgi:hypothetical protein